MKKYIHSLSPCAVLVSCLVAGMAHAQSITLSGDSTPSGSLGASYSGTAITVGNTGPGRLEALGGAVLNNTGETFIGQGAGSSGLALVSDATRWTARNVTVGRFGSGEMTISNGASLVSAQGYIARLPGSTGTVTVDGTGSSWTIPITYDVDFWIGNEGAATLRVLNGATVSTTSDIYTAGDTNASALIEVDGAGSSLSARERCYMGTGAQSTIRISNGGLVSCGIASYLANGLISLTGAGSRWISTAGIDIGFSSPASNGLLAIGEGSTVEIAGDLRLPYVLNASATGVGTINIEGASTPGTLTASQVLFGVNRLGTINFNHSDASGNYTFTTPVSGPGAVNVNNGGVTRLAGNNRYSGTTTIDTGVLRAGSATGLSPASDYVVAAGGTLDTDAFSPTLNSLANAGTVSMLSAGTQGVLSIANDYVGNGGRLQMNTVLGADDAATEKLVVHGDTSGTTTLDIRNLGGVGEASSGNGILVVQVAGASNGTFSLPAPGYLQAGQFRYDLVKHDNNWYLQTESDLEDSPPLASVVCTPSQLTDSDNQMATCTVSLNAALSTDTPINLNLPATSPRYTSTCASPLLIPANARQAACTITAVANTTPNDGDVIAELSIAAPTVTDAYEVVGGPAQVLIMDDDIPRPAVRHAVPTMGALGLLSMASLLGLLGLHSSRKRKGRQE